MTPRFTDFLLLVTDAFGLESGRMPTVAAEAAGAVPPTDSPRRSSSAASMVSNLAAARPENKLQRRTGGIGRPVNSVIRFLR